jgi:hypothetical protein
MKNITNNMAQETAVEWLERLFKEGILIKKSFEIAKQKEKEQIIDAFNSGLAYDYDDSETYYNKTYTNGL